MASSLSSDDDFPSTYLPNPERAKCFYSRAHLLALHASPLVKCPEGMPDLLDLFGEIEHSPTLPHHSPHHERRERGDRDRDREPREYRGDYRDRERDYPPRGDRDRERDRGDRVDRERDNLRLPPRTNAGGPISPGIGGGRRDRENPFAAARFDAERERREREKGGRFDRDAAPHLAGNGNGPMGNFRLPAGQGARNGKDAGGKSGDYDKDMRNDRLNERRRKDGPIAGTAGAGTTFAQGEADTYRPRYADTYRPRENPRDREVQREVQRDKERGVGGDRERQDRGTWEKERGADEWRRVEDDRRRNDRDRDAPRNNRWLADNADGRPRRGPSPGEGGRGAGARDWHQRGGRDGIGSIGGSGDPAWMTADDEKEGWNADAGVERKRAAGDGEGKGQYVDKFQEWKARMKAGEDKEDKPTPTPVNSSTKEAPAPDPTETLPLGHPARPIEPTVKTATNVDHASDSTNANQIDRSIDILTASTGRLQVVDTPLRKPILENTAIEIRYPETPPDSLIAPRAKQDQATERASRFSFARRLGPAAPATQSASVQAPQPTRAVAQSEIAQPAESPATPADKENMKRVMGLLFATKGAASPLANRQGSAPPVSPGHVISAGQPPSSPSVERHRGPLEGEAGDRHEDSYLPRGPQRLFFDPAAAHNQSGPNTPFGHPDHRPTGTDVGPLSTSAAPARPGFAAPNRGYSLSSVPAANDDFEFPRELGFPSTANTIVNENRGLPGPFIHPHQVQHQRPPSRTLGETPYSPPGPPAHHQHHDFQTFSPPPPQPHFHNHLAGGPPNPPFSLPPGPSPIQSFHNPNNHVAPPFGGNGSAGQPFHQPLGQRDFSPFSPPPPQHQHHFGSGGGAFGPPGMGMGGQHGFLPPPPLPPQGQGMQPSELAALLAKTGTAPPNAPGIGANLGMGGFPYGGLQGFGGMGMGGRRPGE